MDLFRKLREKALDYGKSAEKTAVKLLRKNGYKIIETNYRCKQGEIDVVARHGKYLVFCEVKARRNKNYGTALEGVTPTKMNRIRRAAEHYRTKKNLLDLDCRFDVLTIDESDEGVRIELIPNAF